jgi:hypothetical protein
LPLRFKAAQPINLNLLFPLASFKPFVFVAYALVAARFVEEVV